MDRTDPHPEAERAFENGREDRDRAVAALLGGPSYTPRERLFPSFDILCDRAAYEAKHGTLDGPPETHRWDADPF